MSDMKATVEPTKQGFSVCGYEKIEYDFEFLDGVFDIKNSQLAEHYQTWQRCLAVMDLNIFQLYGGRMQTYFDHYDIKLKIHKTMIGEKAKSMDTMLKIVDSMTEFGIYRKEPVLVVGGGLVTDVAGYATLIHALARVKHNIDLLVRQICLCCIPTQHRLYPHSYNSHWPH